MGVIYGGARGKDAIVAPAGKVFFLPRSGKKKGNGRGSTSCFRIGPINLLEDKPRCGFLLPVEKPFCSWKKRPLQFWNTKKSEKFFCDPETRLIP